MGSPRPEIGTHVARKSHLPVVGSRGPVDVEGAVPNPRDKANRRLPFTTKSLPWRTSIRLDRDGKAFDRAERWPWGSRRRANDGRHALVWGCSLLRFGFWSASAAGLLALLFFGRAELRNPGPVSVLPHQDADLRAEVAGTVGEVLVDDGDVVTAGDVNAQRTDRPSLAELVGSGAEIREKRAALSKLEARPTSGEIRLARATVQRAADRHLFSNARVARIETLLGTSDELPQAVDDARALATAAAKDLARAQAALDALLRLARP